MKLWIFILCCCIDASNKSDPQQEVSVSGLTGLLLLALSFQRGRTRPRGNMPLRREKAFICWALNHSFQVRRFKNAVQMFIIKCCVLNCGHFTATIPALAGHLKKLSGGCSKLLYILLVAFSYAGSMSFCVRKCHNNCRKFYPYWHLPVKFTILRMLFAWKKISVAPKWIKDFLVG